MSTASTSESILVRPAVRADMPVLGVLGARLVRLHFDFDSKRFMAPAGNLEDGYGQFLVSLLASDDATVLVAEVNGRVAGYLYGTIEPRSWEELRDRAGFIHDIIIDEAFGGRHLAGRLVDAAIAWFRQRGMPRVVLHTAEQNAPAQHVFTKLGFRRTMIEMTREIE
jgi:ribosomal protein S18 acetylase RimI-like enzyme